MKRLKLTCKENTLKLRKFKVDLTCKFCIYWCKKQITNGVNFRCIENGANIYSENPVCKSFKLADYFFCKKNNYYINSKACISRQRDKTRAMKEIWKGCHHCKEGKKLLIYENQNKNY